jgi:hypothetical protein
MPSFTAAAVTDTISKLRSKIAVHKTLISQLRANYMSSDAGPGELRIQRDDGATVVDSHLQETVEDLEAMIEALAEELEEWENLTFNPQLVAGVPEEAAKEQVQSVAAVSIAKQKKKEAPDATRRPSKNQSATK